MKRIGYFTVMCVAMLALATAAFATPAPNSAKIDERVFNDCPLSTVVSVNAYPASISINDATFAGCVGGANLHVWSFSEDGGVTPTLFKNGSNFVACATFVLDGTGVGEGGLRFGPWWAPLVDGRFMANTNGEIACFGGRLPFYSFTVNHGISYVKGTPITLQMTYTANGLNAGSPATIQYRVTYNAVTYDSPSIPYDEGNPAEEPPHGLWGCLHDAMVGGYFQLPMGPDDQDLTATWTEICFTNNDVVPTVPSTWGRIKTLYR